MILIDELLLSLDIPVSPVSEHAVIICQPDCQVAIVNSTVILQ